MIERASIRENGTGVEAAIARAPADIRARINQARARRGLPQVRAVDVIDVPVVPERERDCGVWWDPRSPFRPAGNDLRVRQPPVTRVIVVAAYGVAAARHTGLELPEWIERGAFGSAEQLNSEPGWSLQDDHKGPILSLVGPSLRAHDTPVGLALEWLPDLKRTDHRAAVDRIAAGGRACSVLFIAKQRREMRLPYMMSVVRKARLLHVALLGKQTPAYAGAVATLFRDRPRGQAELEAQLRQAADAARWYANRAG